MYLLKSLVGAPNTKPDMNLPAIYVRFYAIKQINLNIKIHKPYLPIPLKAPSQDACRVRSNSSVHLNLDFDIDLEVVSINRYEYFATVRQKNKL